MTDYQKYLARIQKRDLATYEYHRQHPEAKLFNARDRRAGYKSRQAVWAAIKRVERRLGKEETSKSPNEEVRAPN